MFEFGARNVPISAPVSWLALAIRDLYAAAGPCIIYGALFAGIGLGFSGWFLAAERGAWIPAISSGFLLLAPVLSVGLYAAGRAITDGKPVTLATLFKPTIKSPTQMAFLLLLLFGLFLLWLSFADAMSIVVGSRARSGLDVFLDYLSGSPEGVNFAIVGIVFGGMLALVAFGLAAVSAPLLMDRSTDVLTAVRFSLSAIGKNPLEMLIWGVLVTALTVFGLVTYFLWFVLIFPWIGLATWRAYLDLVPRTVASEHCGDDDPVVA